MMIILSISSPMLTLPELEHRTTRDFGQNHLQNNHSNPSNHHSPTDSDSNLAESLEHDAARDALFNCLQLNDQPTIHPTIIRQLASFLYAIATFQTTNNKAHQTGSSPE